MSSKKFKRILAQILIIMMMIPNLRVNAVEEDNSKVNTQEVITNDTENAGEAQEKVEDEVTEEDSENDTTTEDDKVLEQDKTESEETNQDKVKDETEVDVKEDTEKEAEDKDDVEDKTDVDSKTNDKEYDDKSTIVDSEVIEGSLIGEEYKKKKVDITFVGNSYSDLTNRIEYKLKMEALSTMTVLETKTDADYEITLAHEDGSFTYVESVDSIEKAVEEAQTLSEDLKKNPEKTMDKLTNMSTGRSSAKLKKLANNSSDSKVLPTVINSNGVAVYSTNAMARIIKYVNKKPDTSGLKTTNVYSDSSLTSAKTYINHLYVEDAPILEDAGKSAKVLVSGTEGWINKNTSSSEYDMVVVPLNQVKNPSYYKVESGELKHYISSDITGSSGYTITIGKAPSYLKSGIRYFSYDGIYFYNGENIESGLNNLINDYKSDSRGKSVNSTKPFYLYYKYLPFRSKTAYNASEINKFINDNTDSSSKLRGIGSALKEAEQKYGVNAILALGIAINESAWGMSQISQTKNNLFGINAVDSNPGQAANEFSSPSASVIEFSKNYISRGYSDPADWRYAGGFLGDKNLGVNVRYASDPYWGEKATQYAHRIDKYLSGSINSLIDTNLYQLGIYQNTNEVRNSSGSLLYAVDNYWSFVGTTFILSRKSPVTVNGVSSYEIYPERTTAATSGKYDGNYNWSKGYIKTSGVKLINTQKDISPPVKVLAGSTRYDTAVALSKSKYSSANTVILVNHGAVIDGVTSAPLATFLKAPILLTDPNVLSEATKKEISRLKAKKVIIVGSEGIVGKTIVSQLKNMGISTVERLAGKDRYGTALAVAKYIDKNCYDVSQVLMVYGHGEPDAVSVSPVSGKNKMPIILTDSNSIRSDVLKWLKSENLKSGYIIGSAGIISNNVIKQLNSATSSDVSKNRIWGSTRYETNAAVIRQFFSNKLTNIYCTESTILIDPLTAGPIAALDQAPIVLIGGDLVKNQKDVLSKVSSRKIIQVGKTVDRIGLNTLRSIVKLYQL